jgi:predicted AlkP superfamily phosphohydrolase/phosphomutase
VSEIMGGNPTDRVLVIGLDMGDIALIEKWSLEGFLPTFRSLMAEGTWGSVKTTAEALHTSSWPTIFTGSLPGKHGVYYPYQPRPGQQQAEHIQPGQYGAQPFWQILDRAGKRCIVLDAPETFPAAGFTGVQIFEWGTWAWYWKRMTTPVEIEKQLTKRFAPYPLKLEAKRLGLAMPDLDYLHRQLIAGAAQKARITKWLMHNHPWDLFLVAFAELHPAGHYLWPENVPALGRDGPGSADLSAPELRDVYAAVDAAIGEIIEECGDGITVLVTSGDGVGPNHCAWHLLPQALTRLGFTGAPSSTSAGPGRSKKSFLAHLRDAVPPRMRSEISSRLPWQLRDRLTSQLAAASTDWSRTKAFSLPADLEGCIRINLRGREPQGIVEPGSQYEDVCAELTEALGELINPATGQAAVRTVCRIDRLFPGDRRDHLPDLTVIWNDDAEICEVYSDRMGLVSETPLDPRTGTHSPVGFIAARGPRSRSGTIQGRHIADLAPTVLAHFGINPPAEMDGRALEVLR